MPHACRSPADLQLLLAGRLTDEQAEELARHLESCDRCSAAVDQILGGSPLTPLLRAQAAAGPLHPLVQQLIPRLRQLRPGDAQGTADLSDAHTPPPAD